MITHFDKDHVGGADKLIKAFPVGQILMPDYESDSKQTRQFFEAIDEYGVACEPLTENRSVDVGPLTFVIDTANESDYGKNEENDFSLVASLKYGSIGFLFTGDAENKRLGELLKEGVSHHDVLKVPHHGRVEKRSASFFEAVSPKHAVITSSQDNPEDTAVVEALKAAGAHVWLTRLGSVIFMTDGQYLDVVQTE